MRTPSAIYLAALLGVYALPRSALAQQSGGGGPAPTVTPPNVRFPRAVDTPVSYPDGATGDATVTVELTIDAGGHVVGVGEGVGPEPFVAAAREAAGAWRFMPAERDGRPVPAKIRFEVRFTGEHPLEGPEPESTPAAPAGSTPVPAPPPQKEYVVTVSGDRPAPGAETVSRTEARMLAGTFGDPIRSVELMAGVTPVVSVVPFFYLRGAPPGNVGYFVDGIRVPFLFHALLGPSVLAPSLIDSTNVYKSAPPVEFGRFAGGIVSSDVAPPPDELHALGSVKTLDASGVVTAPLLDGQAQVFAAARYSYAGLIISNVTNVALDYWDYQVLANYDLSRDDTIGVFAFGALDYVGDKTGDNFAGTQFHRIDLRYDHRFDADTKLRAAVTFGYDQSHATEGDVTDKSVAVRTIFEHRLGEAAIFRAGADASFDDYGLGINSPTLSFRDANILFPPRLDIMTGAYTELEVHPIPRITFRPGVRADVFHSMDRTLVGVDPRVSVEFVASPKVKFVDNFGISHQTPNYFPDLPGAQVGGLPGGLQTTIAYSSGVEVLLPADIKSSFTVFEQAFVNLSDPLGYSGTIAANVDVADVRALGSAYGAEVELRRPLSKTVGGIFSYTLSRSVRSHDNLESLSAFDRTHTVSFAVGYSPGRRWNLGARALFTTGVPTRTLTTNGPEYGGDRAPPFFRLDLHAEKRWKLGQHGYIAAVADVINATAGTEVVQRSCNVQRCTQAGVGPLVLPNVGVEAGF
jgi:hypothetical protein